MKCFLHLTSKRDLLNVVLISSGKEFQILAPMQWKDLIPYEQIFVKIRALTLCLGWSAST